MSMNCLYLGWFGDLKSSSDLGWFGFFQCQFSWHLGEKQTILSSTNETARLRIRSQHVLVADIS